MVIRPRTCFRHPECVICRKSLGKGRVWKQLQGSVCRRCKNGLENLAKAGERQKACAKRLPFRFGLFNGPEDSARAEEIWNKPLSELTSAEREWADGVMNLMLKQRSPRGRKAHAELKRIEMLLVRLALAGKPRPSYGQIAELLLPNVSPPAYVQTEKPQRDRIVQALKRRRKAAQLPSPPPSN